MLVLYSAAPEIVADAVVVGVGVCIGATSSSSSAVSFSGRTSRLPRNGAGASPRITTVSAAIAADSASEIQDARREANGMLVDVAVSVEGAEVVVAVAGSDDIGVVDSAAAMTVADGEEA